MPGATVVVEVVPCDVTPVGSGPPSRVVLVPALPERVVLDVVVLSVVVLALVEVVDAADPDLVEVVEPQPTRTSTENNSPGTAERRRFVTLDRGYRPTGCPVARAARE